MDSDCQLQTLSQTVSESGQAVYTRRFNVEILTCKGKQGVTIVATTRIRKAAQYLKIDMTKLTGHLMD